MTQARVALVTGAARGIGAATVARLTAEGYRVVAFDSCEGADADHVGYPLATRADLEEVAATAPDSIRAVVGDVREPEDLREAVRIALDDFGGLDAVVAAAGVIVGGQPLWESPPDQWRTLLDVNATGVWNTAMATVPALLAQPDPTGGRFVAVASAAGDRGLFRLAGYSASKHAVVGIVRGLAADLVGSGVTAVAVSPGSTDTAMLAATAEIYDAPVDDLVAHQSIRRVISPEEMATAIAWCCSPAGAILNGSVVHADGGFAG